MSRTEPTDQEKKELLEKIEPFLTPHLHHFGSKRNTFAQIDEREKMYGGNGVVYLLQMFEEAELVNNRIGAYMILPEKGTSAGFHTHGTRNEQELYIVIHGEGLYFEKENWESGIKSVHIQKGSVTTIRGNGFHSVENSGNDPLIIFVITTNEP
ncbi:MAG: cupin domain-containing protein [Balneolaceae bacterium]|nr:cupin domain-containing protein [Balneolaceae bacterium]